MMKSWISQLSCVAVFSFLVADARPANLARAADMVAGR